MKAVLRYKDEKSDKFWRIETLDNELAVSYGKWGTIGKTNLKSFDNKEKCEKEAGKLISAKRKKGYADTEDFDEMSYKYVDVEDYSPHILTSHPIFRRYFSDAIYYDCADEFAPFGNDSGNDVMWMLSDRVRKYARYSVNSFIEALIEREWGMTYLPPLPGCSDEEIMAAAAEDFNGMSGQDLMFMCDQVIVATVFGIIKNIGRVPDGYAYLALLSLDRMEQMERLLWSDRNCQLTKYTGIMRKDLKQYIKDNITGKTPVWENAYCPQPKIYTDEEGRLCGEIIIFDDPNTILPKNPYQAYPAGDKTVDDQ